MIFTFLSHVHILELSDTLINAGPVHSISGAASGAGLSLRNEWYSAWLSVFTLIDLHTAELQRQVMVKVIHIAKEAGKGGDNCGGFLSSLMGSEGGASR